MKKNATKDALESIRKLADEALVVRLRKMADAKKPKPVAKAAPKKEELSDDDMRRLMEMYASKQSDEKPEAEA